MFGKRVAGVFSHLFRFKVRVGLPDDLFAIVEKAGCGSKSSLSDHDFTGTAAPTVWREIAVFVVEFEAGFLAQPS